MSSDKEKFLLTNELSIKYLCIKKTSYLVSSVQCSIFGFLDGGIPALPDVPVQVEYNEWIVSPPLLKVECITSLCSPSSYS